MTAESARENVAPAMNATGYFIIEDIEGSEDKMMSFSEKAQRTCPHGVPLDSPERCMACEEISFLRRCEKIITEAGGSIDTISFADKWNEEFNATGSADAMTSEAAATKVSKILASSGLFLVIDTEDPGIKTFTIRPQPEECPHGVSFASQDACDFCSQLQFVQACAYVLQKSDGQLTAKEFCNKWRQTFPNQPEIPEDQAKTTIAQVLNATGVFKTTETEENDILFEFTENTQEAFQDYQRALIQEAMYAHAEKEKEEKKEEIQQQLAGDDIAYEIPKSDSEKSKKVGLGALLD
ncbi:hypothetical protein GUITHDRAFT_109147 [Guillardia theta CCMP2712]|uniref:Uncharacterized protein n=1 Tax=Guillardia theta (strain CCMP2712) TaxID=905079 RepID=L1J9T6_GUITC|nr:hypothetical protein GUITHDRAFT_109147 [Guillardia theta CCMP2712]EKX45102.1 hypothetical protein GUITHDRAFT_109147 [Guillardia theta CCMP2712]|eukprot:XP_005832082.1 hypothetical protein GUITHDRAFT_109147 [Guillardia theta CCMP2712]